MPMPMQSQMPMQMPMTSPFVFVCFPSASQTGRPTSRMNTNRMNLQSPVMAGDMNMDMNMGMNMNMNMGMGMNTMPMASAPAMGQ